MHRRLRLLTVSAFAWVSGESVLVVLQHRSLNQVFVNAFKRISTRCRSASGLCPARVNLLSDGLQGIYQGQQGVSAATTVQMQAQANQHPSHAAPQAPPSDPASSSRRKRKRKLIPHPLPHVASMKQAQSER